MPRTKTKQPGKKKIGKRKDLSNQYPKDKTGKGHIVVRNQIHIDLSKPSVVQRTKKTHKNASQPVDKSPQMPTINLPPPVFGMMPQSNNNSMVDALNLVLAQNKRFEQLLSREKVPDSQQTSPIADTLNKRNTMIDFQSQYPSQESIDESAEEEELSSSNGQQDEGETGYRGQTIESLLTPKETKSKPFSKMSLSELADFAMESFNISSTYSIEGKGKQRGRLIEKQKTKQQLRNEIEEAQKIASKMRF